MSWNTGEPESDLSGNVTLYEVYDGITVRLTGRFNDHWMPAIGGDPIAVTHWKLWNPTPPPPEPGWTPIEEFVEPTEIITLIEVYDGENTALTAWHNGHWIFEVPNTTHWKLLTLSAPPEE